MKKLISLFLICLHILLVVSPVYAEEPATDTTAEPVAAETTETAPKETSTEEEDKSTVETLEAPTPPEEEEPVGVAVSPMYTGDEAPFTGLLLSPELLAQLVAEHKAKEQKVESVVRLTREEEEANCKLEQELKDADHQADMRIAEAQLKAEKEKGEIILERLKKAEKAKPNIVLWTAGGFVVGAGITTLLVFAVSKASGNN